MRKSMVALAAVALFTACDGNPFSTADTASSTTSTTTTTASTIPATISNNLSTFTYDPVAQTVSVAISGLDSTPTSVAYTRNLAAEAGLPAGYEAYSIQEDALDRLFVAVARQSADGSVRAGVASDGGQFNRFFSGAHYERTGDFTPPTIGTGPGAGQVSYAGGYVGLDNWSGPNPTLPAGADPSLQMSGPGRVTGNVFINANFSDMQLNGSVFNRRAIDLVTVANPTGTPLANLILIPGSIGADGTFSGDIELQSGTITDIGDYAGIFGGTDAASLGGALVVTNFLDGIDTESETGIFVLTQCGMTGADAVLCAGPAP